MRLDERAKLAAFSGCAWGLIAHAIGHRASNPWGGLIAAPCIGILMGHLSRRVGARSRRVQIVSSLLFLHLAAVLFVVAMGSFDILSGRVAVGLLTALTAPVQAVLFGLIGSGYFLLLWPLAFFNHRLLWEVDAGRSPAPPQIPLTTAAVRTLGRYLVVLSLTAFFVWTALQSIDIATGISVFAAPGASIMPWWITIDVMGWGNWTAFGMLVWLTAPLLALLANRAAGSRGRLTRTYADLLGVVGFAVLACPFLFWIARFIVVAIKMTLVQSWATEGSVFAEAQYYRNVFWMHYHYLAVGFGLIGSRRLGESA